MRAQPLTGAAVRGIMCVGNGGNYIVSEFQPSLDAQSQCVWIDLLMNEGGVKLVSGNGSVLGRLNEWVN